MRRVLADVVLGWKQFLRGGLILFFALFMFASLGVQVGRVELDQFYVPNPDCIELTGYCL